MFVCVCVCGGGGLPDEEEIRRKFAHRLVLFDEKRRSVLTNVGSLLKKKIIRERESHQSVLMCQWKRLKRLCVV